MYLAIQNDAVTKFLLKKKRKNIDKKILSIDRLYYYFIKS